MNGDVNLGLTLESEFLASMLICFLFSVVSKASTYSKEGPARRIWESGQEA